MAEKLFNDTVLKPCPFCGSKAELKRVGISGWTVICTNHSCFAELAIYGQSQTACESWNRRIYPKNNEVDK